MNLSRDGDGEGETDLGAINKEKGDGEGLEDRMAACCCSWSGDG